MMSMHLAIRNWAKIHVLAFARENNLTETLEAVRYAFMFHKGMLRKNGQPAFVHPFRVCQILIFFGIKDDATLAAALLHDVLEDVSKNAIDVLRGRFSQRVVDLVEILTKTQEMDVKEYCRLIGNNPFAVLIKLADRIHNLRNMIKNLGADEFFSCERLIRQTQETADFIVKLPYLAIFREKDFPSDCPLDYFRIMDLMARELNQTVHVSRVIIADLVV
jgi:(p)ppGpp synthase/HD superfamily hydrolase